MGLTVAFFIILFWIKGVLMLDPDFGWHLRMGEIIDKFGIPKTDPFSYTMPSYPFVDHEWLTNIVLAKLYPVIGINGLAVIFALLAALAMFIHIPLPAKKWSLVPFVLVAGSLLPFVGIRPQIISWFFFSFLILVLFKVYFETSQPRHSGKLEGRIQNPSLPAGKVSGQGVAAARDSGQDGYQTGEYHSVPPSPEPYGSGTVTRQARMTVLKWRFTLPILFIAWANLHGGFGIGFAALSIVTATRMFEHRRILYGDIALLFLCATSTFFNPYGVRLWWELWMQISDTSLRFTIAEWKPALFVPSFALWLFVGFSVFFVTRYRKKFHLSQAVLYYGLLLTGISSIRHMPLFILIAFPMTIMAIEWFSQEANSYKGGKERFRKAYIIFAIGVAFAVVVEALLIIEGTKSSYSSYPKQAVEFLAKNRSCGHLFSTYGWGGYLIWKLPQEKVFIDGRMPSWRWESSPPSESNYAFGEYNKVFSGEIPVKHAIDKYNIDTFLLPITKKKKIDIFKKLKDLEAKLFGRGIDEVQFLKQLKDNGMVEIYKDNTAVIYRQKNYQAQCVKPIQ